MIGVDYHPSFQEIAFLVEETGEYGEQRLNHDGREAEQFYRDLKQRGIHVRVGMEATGYARWFDGIAWCRCARGSRGCDGQSAKALGLKDFS